MVTELLKGPRLVGPLVLFVAVGVGNAAALWQLSNAPLQVGVKTFRLKKVTGRNNAGGNGWLRIGTGTGAGFADAIPPLRILNGFDFTFSEEDLANVEFNADMTGVVDVQPVDVQVEVEEIG